MFVRFIRSYSGRVKYTKSHEWVSVKDGIGTIGITEKGQKELGDVIYVDHAQKKDIDIGDRIAEIESIKATEEIKSPITGTIIEQNRELDDDPSLLNTSAEDKG